MEQAPEPELLPTLLDGAVGPAPTDASEFTPLSRVASDRARPLPVRLAAYEDLIASEVGDTSFGRARNLERESGLRQLFLKFEGSNPTGTQKDRIAFAQVHDALRRGYDAVTIATCGNYGAAMAFAASLAGIRCVIHIPDGYTTRRLDEMVAAGAEIVRVPGDYEAAVEAARARAAAEELYDANPGGDNAVLQMQAYGEVAREIYDELGDAPAVVAVSVSNGTTLAGLHRGFASLWRRGKTSRVPRFVAGSSHGKNPIVRSCLRGLARCEDLDPLKVRETAVNEPLINWHSYDGDAALEAIRGSGGFAADASDRDMLRMARRLREAEGLSVLPASTAGLVVLLARHAAEPLPPDRYVALLTGRR
ncbi:MAG: pyridoxal-phosphate dependent enzyme [Gemmatimonadota bacterium]|nr:pyridoxal-phosphate dependent enzyme [Gemmatimonadota bacterium]